jgi:hypothetical protein
MAFLAPLLAGLASWAIPKGIDWIGHKITGSGGRMRRRGRAMGRVSRDTALKQAKMAAALLAPRAGSLAVMNKWPLYERPCRYNQGGNLPYGPLGVKLPSIYSNTMRGGRTALGGRVIRGGAMLPIHASGPHLKSLPFMPFTNIRNYAGRVAPRPHTVRGHMGANQYGSYGFVPEYTAAGLLSYRGTGAMRRRPAQPSLATVMRGSGLLGGTHYVKPHLSRSSIGTPYVVHGHYAAGARARR